VDLCSHNLFILQSFSAIVDDFFVVVVVSCVLLSCRLFQFDELFWEMVSG